MFFPIKTIILIAICIGIILLQIFLCKKDSKLFGLILPIIFLVFSLTAVMGIATYHHLAVTQVVTNENGEIIEEVVEQPPKQPMNSMIVSVGMIAYIFVVYNIPTIILMLIYMHYRKKKSKKLQLEKMNIQDLE